MSKHTSWHAGGPADLFFTPRDTHGSGLVPAAAARRCAGPVDRARQQSAGARRRHPRRGGLPRTARSARSSARARRRVYAEAGVPCARIARAMRQVGLGPRGILRRHSRHPGRRAGHERRRLGRGDLAPRASRSRCSTAAARCAHARTPSDYAVGYRSVQRPPATNGSSAAHWSSSASPAVDAAAIRELLEQAPRRRSPSASGAAARCSPIRRAITPRG